MMRSIFNLYENIFGSYSEDGCLLNSKEGLQQGDPLGPFLFSLAIMSLIKSCDSELNLWYLDDATLAGDLDTVISDQNLPRKLSQ